MLPCDVDELGRDLLEEPRRRVVLRRAEQAAAPGVGHEQPLAGPGDADVGQAALLLQLVGLGQRPAVREHALLDADQEHDRELQPLGRVQRHQHDLVLDLAVGEVVGVGDQRDLLEELVDAG